MPNWCYTQYIFYTENNNYHDLERFYNIIKNNIDAESQPGRNYENRWLGKIAEVHNIATDEIPCRGSIEYLSHYNTGDTSFALDTETAWIPCTQLWEVLLTHYNDVKFVYLAEEPGMELFINSDVDENYFDQKYLLMISSNTVPNGWYKQQDTKPDTVYIHEYFSDFEYLHDFLSNIVSEDFTSVDDIREYFEEIFDENVIANVYEFVYDDDMD